MPPSLISRMQERQLPPEPPVQNPFFEAADRWEDLRRFATEVLAMARETDDSNRTLTIENDVLRRENERLAAEQAVLVRDNRLIRSYGHALRARLTAIREALESAEREALEYAAEEREPETDEAPRTRQRAPQPTSPSAPTISEYHQMDVESVIRRGSGGAFKPSRSSDMLPPLEL